MTETSPSPDRSAETVPSTTSAEVLDASPAEEAADRLMSRLFWAGLIFVTLYVCYFSHLGAFGLIGPDEPRYAWIARDMAESGDWVTPRLYGQPWFEKPVLYYWGAALSFKLFGVSETTARLPSALFALLATLALAWLALRLHGWELARGVLLMLPSSVAMIGFSHAASTDMPFSAMLSIAMVFTALTVGIVNTSLPPVLRTALFGFFLGAAVLAKGPAALILTGGAIFIWAASTKRWRDVLRLFHPAAIGAFLITALPWYMLCARRNADFFRVFIIEHNFKRYLTPEFQHIQAFWYYLPIAIVGLLPWVLWLAWFALREGRRLGWTQRPEQIAFFAAWGAFPILFFSFSKSKLPGYILPAIPALVFLIAWVFTHTQRSRHHFTRYALALPGLFFLGSACWVRYAKAAGTLVLVYILLASLAGLLVVSLAMLRQPTAALVATVIGLLLLLDLIYVSLEKLDPQISARVASQKIPATAAANTYAFQLDRGWHYQLNFYLHREVLEWSTGVQNEAIVVTSEKRLAELKNSAQIVSVLSDLSPQAEILSVRPLPPATPAPLLSPPPASPASSPAEASSGRQPR
jgi:4-amino-4-deoxy-L-arabinose transferase-like glycosyltransferase